MFLASSVEPHLESVDEPGDYSVDGPGGEKVSLPARWATLYPQMMMQRAQSLQMRQIAKQSSACAGAGAMNMPPASAHAATKFLSFLTGVSSSSFFRPPKWGRRHR